MASTATIRRFLWKDVEQLTHIFNDINGISDTEKAFDVEFMRQFLSQPSCQPEDHCFVADRDGSLAGFALVAVELPISRAVVSGGVLTRHRQQGIGRALLRAATEHAQAFEVSVLHVEVQSGAAQATRILESEGFYRVKRFWQMIWEEDEAPELKLPEGFSLRPFRHEEDEQELTDLQNSAFGENWGFSPNTVEEIAARARLGRVDLDGIIFILDGSRPAAYNWTLRAANEHTSTGWIAMTGVHPDYRGRRLGRAVVTAGMQHLKRRGVDRIELEVDSENDAARELYLKLGFRKDRETVWFEKQLAKG